MKKLALPLAAFALILIGAGCGPAAPVATRQAPAVRPPVAAPPAAPPSEQPQAKPTPAAAAPAAEANVVTYTDSGFSPETLTVKIGTTVKFENKASDAMRVASNPHPIHDGYPTKGGCVSSTFDACAPIAPGAAWSFKFDIAGSWGYHNHLNPSEGGTITVQK